MSRILRMRKLFAARCAAIERPFRRTATRADAGSIPQMGIELTVSSVELSCRHWQPVRHQNRL